MLSRFDLSRLEPVALPEAPGLRRCAASDALVAACRLGAGPASRPLLEPWGAARIEWPFGAFHVRDPAVARRAALLLDGSWAMADAGGAGRLAIRAKALVADLAWWRPLAEGDAWDAGLARHPAALAGFRPRRATLVLVDGAAIDAEAARVIGALEAQAWGWPRALRIVVCGGPVPAFARPL